MERSELQTMVRDLSLLIAGDIDDTMLDRFLNEGHNRIETTGNWPWLTSTTLQAVTVPAVGYVALPAAVKAIVTVLDADGNQLHSVSEQAYEQIKDLTANQASAYLLQPQPGTVSMLFIAPLVSVDTLLTVKYKTTTTFGPDDTDEPPYDERFHTVLVDWALHRLWEREDEMERSDQYRMRYADQVAAMRSWYNDVAQDRPLVFGEVQSPAQTNTPFAEVAE